MMPSQLPLVARPPISTNPARSYGYELLCRAARMSINVPSRIRASSDDRSSVRALLSKSSRAASSKAGSSRIDLQSAATSSRSCKGSRVCDLRPCTPRLRLKSFNHRSVMQSTGGTLPGQSRIDVLKELQTLPSSLVRPAGRSAGPSGFVCRIVWRARRHLSCPLAYSAWATDLPTLRPSFS
jgi:hypothetical protein